ncbi:hypothetical protein NC653_027685 [Populus alba x Populus x berolinensis]|uniref:Uncharacterized protein n=1 Tax=Populus alba x Populus x berolinensis TaxID=444605 RepID=A0AAD6M609_9ROSI|nr:hypothetical protein NC653_027685 [Populus alba x Populus x berolinensis]
MKKPIKFLIMELHSSMWQVCMMFFPTVHHFCKQKMVFLGEMFQRCLLNFDFLVLG